jgi:hypothetical protein
MKMVDRSSFLGPCEKWSVRWALVGMAVAALIFPACSKGGSSNETEVMPESTQVASAAKSPAGAPGTTSMEASMAASMEKMKEAVTSSSGLTSETEAMSPEAKQHLAMMGHALPETPKEELSPLRLAQLAIPPAVGSDKGAEMVVYNFGPGQGGSAMANVQRWLAQVTPDPKGETKLYQQKVNGLTVTEVYEEGTLLPTTMGAGPKEPQVDCALYGIIIEGGKEGSVFIKVTGAKAAIRAAYPALATLAESVKLAQ